MQTPERFSALPAYAFPRLRALLEGVTPGGPEVNMTIGEPRHAMPEFLADVLAENVAGFARYPVNEGTPTCLARSAAGCGGVMTWRSGRSGSWR